MRPTASRLIGLILLTIAACEPEEHGHGHQVASTFPVTRPLRQDTEITREYVCQIRAIQHIELRALERGYLTGIHVDEGELIDAGQRMFQIMPLLYQAELEKAEAEAEFTRIEYQNTKLLADDGVVSPSELALANAKANKANAELQLARVHRDLTEVRAPFSGIMGRFHVRLGSLVEEGELLTTLADNSSVWVYFNVTEAEYLDYMSRPPEEGTGAQVSLVMANGNVFDQLGLVETIEADFNNETGNIAFRATFENPERLLRHGQTGKVRIANVLPGALVIPQKATFEILDQRYVYVLDEEGVVRSRRISVAEELPHVFVVSSGLEETDTIVLEGLRKVREGFPIEVEFQEPSDVLSHLELPAE